MAITITLTDTVSVASMGDGWADPEAVAAGFAGELEETYFSTATGLYPEAVVEAQVTWEGETLGEGLTIKVVDPEPDPEVDLGEMRQALQESLGRIKAELGKAYLTNYEDEEEADDKAELGE